MDHRKAASVFPDPVGATTRAFCPDAMASHAPTWASVGASKVEENQVLVVSEKGSEDTTPNLASSRRHAPTVPKWDLGPITS
jgi:hypothetical protein